MNFFDNFSLCDEVTQKMKCRLDEVTENQHDFIGNKLYVQRRRFKNFNNMYTSHEHEWTWVKSKIKIWEISSEKQF